MKPHDSQSIALLAPIAVFAFHLVAEQLGLYTVWPDLDVVMHLVGGFAMALFLAYVLSGLERTGRLAITSPRNSVLILVGAVALVALMWELFEFMLDRYVGTGWLGDPPDTLLDLTMGVVGAFMYAAVFGYRAR